MLICLLKKLWTPFLSYCQSRGLSPITLEQNAKSHFLLAFDKNFIGKYYFGAIHNFVLCSRFMVQLSRLYKLISCIGIGVVCQLPKLLTNCTEALFSFSHTFLTCLIFTLFLVLVVGEYWVYRKLMRAETLVQRHTSHSRDLYKGDIAILFCNWQLYSFLNLLISHWVSHLFAGDLLLITV